MIGFIRLLAMVAFIVGAIGGWQFVEAQAWGSFIAFVVAVVCGVVCWFVVLMVGIIVIAVIELIEDARFEHMHGSNSRAHRSFASGADKGKALDSMARRYQADKPGQPPAPPTPTDADRDAEWRDRLRNIEPLPPIDDV